MTVVQNPRPPAKAMHGFLLDSRPDALGSPARWAELSFERVSSHSVSKHSDSREADTPVQTGFRNHHLLTSSEQSLGHSWAHFPARP